ncbi:MAG TPA: glycosyltransferase family 8 protein [Opitutus sp.]|nr:glycosyltransferase family 8 protein [Opitutus sp.]
MESDSSSNVPPRIEIAFGCDHGYLQPLTVAIVSILATSLAPSRLRFWLVTKSLNAAALAPLRAIIEENGAELETRTPLAEKSMETMPLGEHFTEATYYRLLLPRILPANVSRLIYLDSDVIVRHPIEHLWSVQLGKLSTAAVFNPRALTWGKMGLRREQDYFNAGVLLMDLNRWRAEQIDQRALNFAAGYAGALPCADQDALNHVLAGAWKRLDLRWNQQFKFFQHSARYLQVSWLGLWRAKSAPYIVHYSTNTKPWHSENEHPWRALYFEQLDLTNYRGWRPAAPLIEKNRHDRISALQRHCQERARALKSLFSRRQRRQR